MRRALLSLGLVAALAACPARADGKKHEIYGPADAYVYELAAPGTYDLPRIKRAGDGEVLDEKGGSRSLTELLSGRISVLAFIYTRCGDVCPLASMRLAELRDLVTGRPTLRSAVQIVSLSFDPEHDTPSVMASYGESWRDGATGQPAWMFLTTKDRDALRPILRAYDQPVATKADQDDPAGPFSHLLRVFLVDPEGNVRNIYSADFLDARLLINDILTLLGSKGG